MDQQNCVECSYNEPLEENLEELVKLKFLLKGISKNLSELQKIKIMPKNFELQKLKQDLECSMNIDTPSTFNSTSNYLSKQVEGYLKKHCNHNYIEDIYDVGEDGFKKVCYCNKCYDGY
ncbi:MAG: hypothetical protein ACYSOW_11845 [Planctomycetota bacterium]|jgi:hypothetical protein